MIINKRIFVIHSVMRTVLLAIPLFILLFLYISLKNGLTISNIKLAGFQVRGLYLKLDKKLTLRAEYIHIPAMKRKASLENIEILPKRIHRFLRYVDYLEMKDVEFVNDHYRLVFSDNIIYIVNDEYELAGNVRKKGDTIEIAFPVLFIKRLGGSFKGVLRYNYKRKDLLAEGDYSLQGIKGRYRISLYKKNVNFIFDSSESGNVSKLITLLPLKTETKKWLKNRVEASSFEVNMFSGKGIFNKGRFRIDPSSLEGDMVIKKASLKFDDRLRKIKSSKVDLKFHNSSIYFDLKNPEYNGKSIKGSRAAIVNLGSRENLLLLLRLKYSGKFDKSLKKVLKRYKVDLELDQKKGRIYTEVDIDIPLGRKKRKTIALKGKTDIHRSVFDFGGFDFAVESGRIVYNTKKIIFRDMKVSSSGFSGTAKGEIDLKKGRGKIDLFCKKLIFDKKSRMLRIRNKKLLLKTGFGKKITLVKIPSFKSRFFRNKNTGTIKAEIDDLSIYRPYLSSSFSWVDGGSLVFKGSAAKGFAFRGDIVWKSSPFYRNSSATSKFDVEGRIGNRGLFFNALGKKLVYDESKNLLLINNIDIDLERLVKFFKSRKNISNKSDKNMKLTIKAKKSRIKYGKYVLLTNSYNVKLSGTKMIFTGILGSNRVNIRKNGSSFNIAAKNIDDRMLHSLIHFNGLYGGRYTITAQGSEAGGFNGNIHIDGGVIRDFKAYNDLIALFNTVPALITFSSPGFSSKGFVIKTGEISFFVKGDLLLFKKIELIGRSSTIVGKGKMNLKSKAIDIELGIQTAREVGKSIGSLPILGYIIFGKDKSLTTGVKISGTLDKPKVKTNPIGQALLYPLQLLKRTITAPASLGGDTESKKDEKRKNEKPKRRATPSEVLSGESDAF